MPPLPLSSTPASAPSPPAPKPNPQPNPKLKKRTSSTPHIIHASTLRHPQYTYFHLTLTPSTAAPSSSFSSSQSATINSLLVSQLLTQALSAYLGLTGAAIPVDILKSEGRDVWIRVPSRDGKGVRAGLSSWWGKVGGVGVSWRVRGEGQGLGLGLGGGDGEMDAGREVFGD